MPAATRALTRAARERAKANGIPYTEARDQLLNIRELVDDGEFETTEDADAFVSDPANQVMCTVCGWTNGMVCPECLPGCGCSVGCSGWRHDEWGHHDDDPDPDVCFECGGMTDGSGYGCECD